MLQDKTTASSTLLYRYSKFLSIALFILLCNYFPNVKALIHALDLYY